MNPSKDAISYWQAVNRSFLGFDEVISDIWREEKRAAAESIVIAREEALTFLATERERVMRLSKEEAIKEVLKWRKIGNRVKSVNSVIDNGILELN
jgi:type II restriction enzyme